MALLDVSNLRVRFRAGRGFVTAVDGVSFQLQERETLAIVGESGCGKSVAAMALTRLLPASTTQVEGQVHLQSRELLGLPERQMRHVRGRQIATVFQDPSASFNPVLTVGEQIVEAIRMHESVSHRVAWQRATELLELVSIPEPGHRMAEYPHRFSGGMRQRAAIAMALAAQPKILIADEPTTALDVTIQAQILALLKRLQRELGMGLLLITHDLGVVAETADRVMIMYAGRKVEEQPVRHLFDQPQHPYTRKLMGARPRMDLDWPRPRPLLPEIPGMVPPLHAIAAQGCTFATRCHLATDHCRAQSPPLTFVPSDARGAGALVACWDAMQPAAAVAHEKAPHHYLQELAA
ncbi:ABC transporter ATP-binding protein [Lampropedia puyangensis]|uniref:ABC transporter ATP-binding protein n=1 Tax=Lampropedia puyangensis TaxID=1330072 RepID=A0A4S8EWV9_9BURK|nr:ABC transporter ATP-binding protein [Lampropedia puyangensis]THT98093.1 ABC transporter ATP-binding protein [Lampropedia puyangensis]